MKPARLSAPIPSLTNSTFSFTTVHSPSSALPTVTSGIVIEGNGSTIERMSGSPGFRLFRIATTGTLRIEETTISGGSVSGNGGGLYNQGVLQRLTKTFRMPER